MLAQAYRQDGWTVFVVEQSAEPVTLVPVGPLTNIAMALLRAPEIREQTRGIVLMGGAARFGNVTPAAEFNIFVDPEAAAVVFGTGLPITMVGLDADAGATHRQNPKLESQNPR